MIVALVRDLRIASRRLWKDRGFTFTAVLTLVVCLGVNAALFAVIDHVLLRPLSVPAADGLVLVYNSYPNAGVTRAGATGPDYVERRQEVPAFEHQALFRTDDLSFEAGDTPERVHVMRVTPSFFPLTNVPPQRGRTFGDDTAEVGHNRELILSDGFWRQAFGGRDDVLGQSVRLDGEPHTIVGVMPAGFTLVDTDVQA